MLDVVNCGAQRTLVIIKEPLLDLLRIQARILPNDANHRDVDGGENVRRGVEQDERRHQQEHQRPDHEGIGAAQRKTYNPHNMTASLISVFLVLKRLPALKPEADWKAAVRVAS